MTRALADLYPAHLDPWPDEVPRRRVRAVVTEGWTAVAWEGPNRTVQVHHLAAPEDAVTASGGTVDGVAVSRGKGCKCGSRTVQNASVDSLAPPEPEVVEPLPDEV